MLMLKQYLCDVIVFAWIASNRVIDCLITIYAVGVGYVETAPVTAMYMQMLKISTCRSCITLEA